MSRPIKFRMFAGGKQIHARLVIIKKGDYHNDPVCPYCKVSTNMMFIAEMTQYSFVEDRHWHIYNCQQCEQNTCFQFDKKLTLSKTISRLK